MAKFTTYKIAPVEAFPGVFVREVCALHQSEIAQETADLTSRPVTEQTRGLALICLRACCDEAFMPVFESIDEVLQESGDFINTCAGAAMDVNGIGAEDDAKN